jgi:hypothetical protein
MCCSVLRTGLEARHIYRRCQKHMKLSAAAVGKILFAAAAAQRVCVWEGGEGGNACSGCGCLVADAMGLSCLHRLPASQRAALAG